MFRKIVSRKNKHCKYYGFTVMEVLTAIGMLVIVTMAILVNFRESNNLDELKTSMENLVDDLQYYQLLAASNIKLADLAKVEKGYAYAFVTDRNFYVKYIILSDTVESETYDYRDAGRNYFYSSDVIISDVRVNIELFSLNTESPKKWLPRAQAVAPVMDENKIARISYFFPDAGAIIESIANSGSCGRLCNTMAIYLKHSEIDDKRGLIEINRASGRIDSSIIDNP